MKKTKKVTFSVYMDSDQYIEMRQKAADDGRGVSSYIRQLIRKDLGHKFSNLINKRKVQ